MESDSDSSPVDMDLSLSYRESSISDREYPSNEEPSSSNGIPPSPDRESSQTADVSREELRPKMARSKYWTGLIDKNLKMDQSKNTTNGRLDPQKMFKSRKAVQEFYSDHSVHLSRIKDNQLFAQWAIEEALQEYSPENTFQVTGNIMQGERVTTGLKTPMPKEVVDAIRTEEQKDVDTEDPNGKEHDHEIVQDCTAAAEKIIAASPNSAGPPIEACASYLYMKKCGEYGRNKLTVWKSPLFPKLDGQDGRRGLLDNQLTGIVWIMSRFLGRLPQLNLRTKKLWNKEKKNFDLPPETVEQRNHRARLRSPRYFGAILADSMGLGKTLTTIACIDLLVGQGLNVKVEGGRPKYRPVLILTPNATVASQWVDEIDHVHSRHGIKKILLSGSGSRKKRQHDRVRILTCKEFECNWPDSLSYVWDESNPDAARTVFVMSIDAWSRRTCRLRKKVKKEEGDDDEWERYSTYTEQGRKFSIVVVDEAYKVKNAATGYFKSVALLEREFTLLITATPCMNTLSDLLGPARLLWQRPEKYLQEEQKESWQRIEGSFNDLTDLKRLENKVPYDDCQLVAGRPAMLTKLIQSDGTWGFEAVDIGKTRMYLKYFYSLAILQRSANSIIFSDWENTKTVCLNGLLPNVEDFTVSIQPDYALEREYQDVHMDLLIQYLDAVKNWYKKADTTPIMSTYRRFILASASLDVFRLDKLFAMNEFGTLTEHIKIMRRSRITFKHLAQFLLEPNDPKPETALDYIKLAVRRSPILRYILHYVKENILQRGETGKIKKLLITEASPMLAYYYELVLQFLLVNCRTLHAGLSQEERRELIESFNDESDESCQVMIQMYTVGFAGTNLHRSCSQVLIASQAHSLPVQWQTVHRVIRVGQESDVRVHRLKVNNTFHSFRESRQVEKKLPELGINAQGFTNEILISLLNHFQGEVDEAYESPEGQRLLRTKDLTLDPYVFPEDGPATKRVKLEDGTAAETTETTEAEAVGQSPLSPVSTSSKRKIDTIRSPVKFDCAGYFRKNNAFDMLKTRNDYYEEYKEFPIPLRTSFSNKKNDLRRLLTYRRHSEPAWEVEDLLNPAVLERAMELVLRIRLGTERIEMLPYPLIDFTLVSSDKIETLANILEGILIIDQDLEASREEAGAKSRSGKCRQEDHDLRNIHEDMTLSEIDQEFNDSVTRTNGDTNRRLRNASRREEEERAEVEGAVSESESDPEEDDSIVDDGNDSPDDSDNISDGEKDDLGDGDNNSNEKDTDDEKGEESDADRVSVYTALESQDDPAADKSGGDSVRSDDDKKDLAHVDSHDEDDEIVFMSSRSIDRYSPGPSDVKIEVKTEAAEADIPRASNADAQPGIKTEDPGEGTDPAAPTGSRNIPGAVKKEESPGWDSDMGREPIWIEDSDIELELMA